MRYVVYRCRLCDVKIPDTFEGTPLRECQCGAGPAALEYHELV